LSKPYRNAYIHLIRKSEGKRVLCRHRYRLQGDIRMAVDEIRLGDVGWMGSTGGPLLTWSMKYNIP
jgi:hypothetical protein